MIPWFDRLFWWAVLMGYTDEPYCGTILMGYTDALYWWAVWRTILTGNIDGLYWWAIMMGVIDGLYWWAILIGSIDRQYWWAAFKLNFRLSLWERKNNYTDVMNMNIFFIDKCQVSWKQLKNLVCNIIHESNLSYN